MVEELVSPVSKLDLPESPPIPIDAIETRDLPRLKTGLSELDRVLGGGIVPGSAILIGGAPGIGKSTLMMQTLSCLLYTSPSPRDRTRSRMPSSA